MLPPVACTAHPTLGNGFFRTLPPPRLSSEAHICSLQNTYDLSYSSAPADPRNNEKMKGKLSRKPPGEAGLARAKQSVQYAASRQVSPARFPSRAPRVFPTPTHTIKTNYIVTILICCTMTMFPSLSQILMEMVQEEAPAQPFLALDYFVCSQLLPISSAD